MKNMKNIKNRLHFLKESKIAKIAIIEGEFEFIFIDEYGNSLWVFYNNIYILVNPGSKSRLPCMYIFKNQINYNNEEELINILKNYNKYNYIYNNNISLEENLFNYYGVYNEKHESIFIDFSELDNTDDKCFSILQICKILGTNIELIKKFYKKLLEYKPINKQHEKRKKASEKYKRNWNL